MPPDEDQVMNILKKIRKSIKNSLAKIYANGKTKYFCIGRNKTGTTSIEKAFKDLGFIMGNQRAAEILFDKYYFEGHFEPIIEFCKSAQVFQDVPFSCPETYKHLDQAFPGSKFILSIRDDPEQWYQSLTRYHAKKFGLNGRIPTAEDLKNATYVRKGWMHNTVRLHGTPENDPYNKKIMLEHYEKHNREIIAYFRNRPNDLLVINLAEKNAYHRFIKFIGMESPHSNFPWENKT